MGDEVVQRGVSDAESVGVDVSNGVVEPRDTEERGRKELEDGSTVPVVSWDYCFFGARIELVKQRWNSAETVRSW